MSSTCRKLAINDQLKVTIRQALIFSRLFLDQLSVGSYALLNGLPNIP